MNRKKIFKNPNVTLIGKGYKRKDGKILLDKKGNPIEAIIIGVAEKKPISEIKSNEEIGRAHV